MDPEKSLRTWKRIALVSLAVAVLVSGVAILLLRLRFQREDRLLGVWQSDADRTIAAIREVRPVDEAREGALRKLYGKLRITYTGGTYTSDFDGITETTRYEVLGKDDRSVVIGEIDPKPSEQVAIGNAGLAGAQRPLAIDFDVDLDRPAEAARQVPRGDEPPAASETAVQLGSSERSTAARRSPRPGHVR